MTRRKENRIYPEDFGAGLEITIPAFAAFGKYSLLNISITGCCISLDKIEKARIPDTVEINLLLPSKQRVSASFRVVKVENSFISFEASKFMQGKEHLEEFINNALSSRKKKCVPPPQKWLDAQLHFTSTLEHSWYNLLFRLYGDIIYTTNDFYRKRNYTPALMPITVESVSSPMGLGSDSLPVQVSLFNTPTYLADSMQFQLEYLLRQNVPGVFYIMPTFRGETPDTRHLNQFFHSEAEIQGSLEDTMRLIEDYLAALSHSLLTRFEKDITIHAKGDISHIKYFLSVAGRLPRVSYEEAVALIGNEPGYFDELPGGLRSINRHGEQELVRRFGGFVWIMYPPHAVVPFYQGCTKDGKHALSADLLMGIGETVGCGERHTSGAELQKALDAHQVSRSSYEWYINMKELYPMRTSGFGLGIERYLLWLLHHNDIRDMAIFSRLKGVRSIP